MNEKFLVEMGLRQVENLEEICYCSTFFVDSNFNDNQELLIYPNGKQVHLSNDLLKLYSVHWRYHMNTPDTLSITKQEGDTDVILHNVLMGNKHHKHAKYAFTKQYLERNKSLWIFIPGTPGWDFYQNEILSLHADYTKEYKAMKKKNKQIKSFI